MGKQSAFPEVSYQFMGFCLLKKNPWTLHILDIPLEAEANFWEMKFHIVDLDLTINPPF